MSTSHGAGRLMSRHEARNILSLIAEQKLLEQRNIIHSIRSVKYLDEAASAYKDIDEVMAKSF
ncbi:MAG: RtcB family protein [Bacteroidales bacterium]|nr:RtcB family protein [Bacteroidales bacterium]